MDLTKYERPILEGEVLTEEQEAAIKNKNERRDHLNSHRQYMENVARREQSMAMDRLRSLGQAQEAQIQAQSLHDRPGSLASLGGLGQARQAPIDWEKDIKESRAKIKKRAKEEYKGDYRRIAVIFILSSISIICGITSIILSQMI